MTSQSIQAEVSTRANLYFDGKCVSHGIVLADGSRKSIGVILPSTLTFNTAAAEVMELVEGSCRVRHAGSAEWLDYRAGQSFDVPANSSFEIDVQQPLHYVCHFG